MPYPIKNTTLQQTNTVRTLNFAFGVNQGGYGLTSLTAFWNGKPPNVFGYIVYVGNGTSSPTMYVVPDDSQLITLSNTLGGGSNTTIQLALNYFINSANSVCLNVEPPNIVTNGLVVYLDAGFTPSYPKGFNTWYDTSQNLNNGVLTNEPTYNYADGGSLVFDGIDDKVVLPHILNYNLTTLTVLVWIKPTSPYTGAFRAIISKEGADRDWNFYLYSSASNGVVNYYHFSTARASSYPSVVSIPGNSLTLDVWHQCGFSISNGVLTYYLDGVVIASGAINFSSANSSYPITIGGADNYTKGDIMTSQVYNRGLTNQEVLQNYYAGLERLIPVSLLLLWIDGENTNTRVITPTTAYDRSSYYYNGSLMNSMGLSHRNAGTSFSFDGVDDYINLGSPYRIGISVSYLTVSIWFKLTTTPVGSDTFIKFGASNAGWAIGISSSGIYYSLYTTTVNFLGGGLPVGGSISLNVWHNVTFTFNGSGTFIMYLDGVEVVTTTSTAGGITDGGSTVVNIGRDGTGSGSNYFKGDMSIVRVFYDTLTSAQVLNIYNAGKQRHGL